MRPSASLRRVQHDEFVRHLLAYTYAHARQLAYGNHTIAARISGPSASGPAAYSTARSLQSQPERSTSSATKEDDRRIDSREPMLDFLYPVLQTPATGSRTVHSPPQIRNFATSNRAPQTQPSVGRLTPQTMPTTTVLIPRCARSPYRRLFAERRHASSNAAAAPAPVAAEGPQSQDSFRHQRAHLPGERANGYGAEFAKGDAQHDAETGVWENGGHSNGIRDGIQGRFTANTLLDQKQSAVMLPDGRRRPRLKRQRPQVDSEQEREDNDRLLRLLKLLPARETQRQKALSVEGGPLFEIGGSRREQARAAAEKLWQQYSICAQSSGLIPADHLGVAGQLGALIQRWSRGASANEDAGAVRMIAAERMLSALEEAEEAQKRLFADREGQSTNRIRLRADLLRIQALALLGDQSAACEHMDHVLQKEEGMLAAAGNVTADSPTFRTSARPTEVRLVGDALAALLDGWLHQIRQVGRPSADVAEHQSAVMELLNPTADSGRAGKGPKMQSRAEADGSVAERAIAWMLRRPSLVPFVHFSFSSIESRFNKLVTSLRKPGIALVTLDNELEKDLSQEERSAAVAIFTRALAARGAPEEAFRVFRIAARRNIALPESLGRQILRRLSLAKEDVLFDDLNRQLRGLSRRSGRGSEANYERATYATQAYHYARQGDLDRVQHTLRSMARDFPSEPPSREFSFAVETLAASSRGDVQSCLHILEQRYDFQCGPGTPPVADKQVPNVSAFTRLIQAHVRSDDVPGAERLLDRMTDLGLAPNTQIYNLLIDALARRVDVPSALGLLDQMREAGIRPNHATYTSLINMFSLRKDPESAARAVRAMFADGLTPDRHAYVALMDAHVEAGSFDAAIGVYRWMRSRREPALQPNVAACNTLLKAYVIRAAPVQTVLRVFAEMRQQGIQPNAHSYALILQSTCDAGLMDMAEDIFTHIERKLPSKTPGEGANVYHFSIMIHGYLRMRRHSTAKEYFDEMKARGIQPSSVTYGLIVGSYAKSDSDANMEVARDLVARIVSEADQAPEFRESWDSPTLAQGLPFETIYGPLIDIHAKRIEPEMAERLFREMVEVGSKVSIKTFTSLLDAYRRAGDIDAALELWNRLYAFALRTTEEDTSLLPLEKRPADTLPLDPSRRNLLCLPLSIMIDLLSHSGRHDQIASLWARLRSDGFAFDPHNWNHLAVALVRAARIEDAMRVIENVLYEPAPDLDRARRLREASFGANKTASEEDPFEEKQRGQIDETSLRERFTEIAPLPQEVEPTSLESANVDPENARPPFFTASPARPPNRRHQNRVFDDRNAPLPFEPDEEASIADDDVDSDHTDLSVSLRKLREFELQDSYWFAHFKTLESVVKALDRISRGSELHPQTHQDEDVHHVGDDVRDAGTPETERPSQSGYAAYSHLMGSFPRAARILQAHRRKVEMIEAEARARAQTHYLDTRSWWS